MDNIIKFLAENNKKYEIGLLDNGVFYAISNAKKDKQVIKLKWKRNSLSKLIKILNKRGVYLSLKYESKYNCLYDIIGTSNQLLIIYAVNSHVQLPKLLLNKFRTGDHLYYLDTSKNKINKSSASTYNTQFGYYSLQFEDYLNKNYESIISDIINTVIPFINKDKANITLENSNKKINKLFLMSLFRNPEFVRTTNDRSIFGAILKNGYDAEYLALMSERLNENFIKEFKPILLVNSTSMGLLTLKSFISNLKINGGIESMAMLFHPKFAIALIPISYYKKMVLDQGDNTYLLINDEKQLRLMNRQIYFTAKYHHEDVIGVKSDLENLCIDLKFMQKRR